jgi:hypothetical protein
LKSSGIRATVHRSPSTALRRLAGILLLLSLAACHHHLPPPTPGEAADILSILDRRWKSIQALQCEGGVVLSLGESRYPGKMVLAVSKPDRLRVDFFDPIGRIKGLAVIDGDRFTRWPPEIKREGTHGGTELSPLSDWTRGLDGPPADNLSAVLTGHPGGSVAGVLLFRDQRDMPGTVMGEGRKKVILLDTFKGQEVIRKLALEDPLGGATLTVRYSGYRLVEGIPLPGRVELTLPEKQVSLKINYRSFRLNGPISDEVFDVSFP